MQWLGGPKGTSGFLQTPYRVQSSRISVMTDKIERYDAQKNRISTIATRMGMTEVYFELRDKPDVLTFKVFGKDRAGRLTISVEELEGMTDDLIETRIRSLTRLR